MRVAPGGLVDACTTCEKPFPRAIVSSPSGQALCEGCYEKDLKRLLKAKGK